MAQVMWRSGRPSNDDLGGVVYVDVHLLDVTDDDRRRCVFEGRVPNSADSRPAPKPYFGYRRDPG